MGLAKGFRFINFILLVGALVLFLITPLYYNKSSIAVNVADGIDKSVVFAVEYRDAEDADYIILNNKGEYAIVTQVNKTTKTATDNTDGTTKNATVYEITADLYRDEAKTGSSYVFTLNDTDFDRAGKVNVGDKYYLSDRSTTTTVTVHEGATKYLSRDVLIRFTAVTGAGLIFGSAFSSTTNIFMIVVSLILAGALALLVSFILMRKRTEILAANVVSGAASLIASVVAVYFVKNGAIHAEAGGSMLLTLSVALISITAITSFLAAALGMKSRENKTYGTVLTVLGLISLILVLIFGLGSSNMLPFILALVIDGVCLMAVGIVTTLVFAKSTKNDKLNENCVEEEDNTYVDPNAQQAVEE